MSFRSSICIYDNSIMKVLLKACLKYNVIAFACLERLFLFSLDMEFRCLNIIVNVVIQGSKIKLKCLPTEHRMDCFWGCGKKNVYKWLIKIPLLKSHANIACCLVCSTRARIRICLAKKQRQDYRRVEEMCAQGNNL